MSTNLGGGWGYMWWDSLHQKVYRETLRDCGVGGQISPASQRLFVVVVLVVSQRALVQVKQTH